MDLDPALAERIVGEMVEHAQRAKSFVRIDMEGSEYTEATIAMTERLNARWPGCVGTVLQAYLMRTAEDARRLAGQGIRIRLCKGAYKEPGTIAFAEKADVDRNYCEVMTMLATSGVFCGMATHDEVIIEAMRSFVTKTGLDKSAFEFQMLYGDQTRPATETRGRGLRRAGLCAVWARVVSVLHAAACGTSGECAVSGEELLQELREDLR